MIRPRFDLPPPLAIYVHVPWCVRKCPYCDFNSHALGGALPEAAYLDALLRDVDAELPRVWGRRVGSVFIGGGTPSLLQPRTVARLLRALGGRLRLRPGAEITLEANPGAVDAGRFRGFVDAGVTRLSVGVQSFHDDLLARIGRVHDAAAARSAAAAAAASGAGQVNLDLMFALPGQTAAQARDDLSQAIALGADHISYYQLTLEPNTEFHRNPPALPTHESAYDMQCAGIELLQAAGYRRYEVSSYAREGARCAHNLNYWRFGDYLGLGAGAHGKVTLPAESVVIRHVKQRQPARYVAHAGRADGDLRRGAVAPEELPFEFMLNALRLVEGFEPERFTAHTGLALDCMEPALAEAERDGLLVRTSQRIAASALGQRFLDDLVARFLPQAAPSAMLY